MHLWPTYYTLEIRVYILNLSQFSAYLQILYISQISFCGMLYSAGYYVYFGGVLWKYNILQKEIWEMYRKPEDSSNGICLN
jgi:hypothetical protein